MRWKKILLTAGTVIHAFSLCIKKREKREEVDLCMHNIQESNFPCIDSEQESKISNSDERWTIQVGLSINLSKLHSVVFRVLDRHENVVCQDTNKGFLQSINLEKSLVDLPENEQLSPNTSSQGKFNYLLLEK